MINRIKTMQQVYAFERGASKDADHYRKELKQSIQSFNKAYLYHLYCINGIVDYVEDLAQVIANKHLPKDEDKNFSTKLLSNIFIKYLSNNEGFKSTARAYKFDQLKDEELIKKTLQKLRKTEEYADYVLNKGNFDIAADAAIIKYIYEDLILSDEEWISHFEDIWPWCAEDFPQLHLTVLQTIKKSKSGLKLSTDKDSYKTKFAELQDFAVELFNVTTQNTAEHNEIISEKLKNWESERLASMDMILMRMAISELKEFPSIPVKVTINEYVDISKAFSTPKSSEFINGILDKIMKELKESKQLFKEGRGLLEN